MQRIKSWLIGIFLLQKDLCHRKKNRNNRQEICLNGLWDFQPVAVSRDWKQGNGVAPILTEPREGQWEQVKIKIPSPWNVNDWGGGIETGEGSKNPYAPSSVYYPSYPSSWIREKMGWLRREF